jgi:oligopeptidase B
MRPHLHSVRLPRLSSAAALVAAGLLCACASSPPPPPPPPVASPVAAAPAEPPAPSGPQPPVARKEPKETQLHGEKLVDNYAWLQKKGSPDVVAHLKAENVYTDQVMSPFKPLEDQLYAEMLGRIKQDDNEVPYRQDGYFYYSRTETGKQYSIFCRKKGSLKAKEEILIDLNQMAAGKKFIALGGLSVSDDGRLMAYSIDETGFREYTLQIKDLRTGTLLPVAIKKVRSIAWSTDRRTLFYVVEDSAKRPYRLHRLKVTPPVAAGKTGVVATSDAPVFEEKDERFNLGVERTRSKQFILVSSSSHTQTEVRFLRSDRPLAAPQLIAPREKDHEYDVDHHGDRFFIRTNKGGRNFKLVSAPVKHPEPANWKDVVPHREAVMLEAMDFFKGHYVLYEREDGLPQLRITDMRSGQWHRVALPEPVYTVGPGQNREWDTRVLRFEYESLITPRSVYDYRVDTRQRTLMKRQPVLGGYDPTLYRSERIHAIATDGTRIPISLVYKHPLEKDGKRPLLLGGYGAYGFSVPMGFNSSTVSLLDRGVVWAWAHIRGGGDLGKKWHDAGRMMNKRNSFTDFIAAGEHLVRDHYTSQGRIVARGGSAGGLLMGAVINLSDTLFKAVVLQVPFVDVINTMLDESLPLTVGEFEEWGNPKKRDEYEYIRSYSPYENLRQRAYPSMLVRTSYNDSQVMYWEPAKYVAKLRTLKRDGTPLIFKINLDPAGHGGASGRFDKLRELAFDYSFILWQMGLATPAPAPAAPPAAAATKSAP